MCIRVKKNIVMSLLGLNMALCTLTGCSDKVIEPEAYDFVLEDISYDTDLEVQEFVNEIPFSNEEFRLAYSNYISNHIMRQNYLVYDYWEIEMLDLSCVSDLTDLRLFPNLKKVIIRDSVDVNLEQLNDTNIKIVEVYNSTVDASNIDCDIEILVMHNTDIENTESLANLTKLQDLEINFSNVQDISFLSNMKKLRTLSLISNDIIDYSVLSDLKLDELILSCTQVNDWSFISELKTVKSLNIAFTNFNDISLLTNLSKLENLDLSYTLIENINGIEDLKNLESLNLSACYMLDDYSYLANIDQAVSVKLDNMEMKYDNFTYFNSPTTLSDDQEVKTDVIEFYNSLGITDDLSDEEKVRIITIAVLERVAYISDLTLESSDYCNDNELRSALDGEGLCSSYTALTSELLNLAGVKNYEITGTAIESEPDYLHKWNIVNINGEWYGLDLTFLDDLDGANRLRNGEDVSYYLSDLNSTEWEDLHYYFAVPSEVKKVLK